MTRWTNGNEGTVVAKPSCPRTLDDLVHSLADRTKSTEDGLLTAFGEVEIALR